MEIAIAMLLPVLFLTLAASMLVVSQFSGFFQFGRYSGRRKRDRQELETFMTKVLPRLTVPDFPDFEIATAAPLAAE